MPRFLEPFSGGLVTVRDPAVLAIGEMVRMQNAVYWPGDQAPQGAAGRAAFGAVGATATPVQGLRSLKYDNGDYFLLAQQGTTLASALVGDTGTFASCFAYSASGTAFDAIHYNDEWFLFGSVSADNVSASGNVVAYLSATAPGQSLKFRPHGLKPTEATLTYATGAGTWTAGATGYFEYWYTEVYEYTKDGLPQTLESAFTGTPLTIFINSTALQASIYMPLTPTNPDATKWKLYRAGPKLLATDTAYPTGFKLSGPTVFGTTLVLDGSATTGAYVAANATGSNGGLGNFTNPTNIFSSDNTYATFTAGVFSTTGAVAAAFPTFTITEPVVGITVSVEIKHTGQFACSMQLSNDSGVTWGESRLIAPITGSDTVIEVGGPSDLWGLPWSNTELTAGKFLARVKAVGIASQTVSIDQIRAKITANGSVALNEAEPYPAVVISAAGVDSAVGSHGHPPVATTADIFQGTLVTNSRPTVPNSNDESSYIRYSLPDQPDYFPAPYYLDFPVGPNDVVTNIKTLNNRLGVFLNTSTWRVNYLPTEADADFNRGICREQVSSQYGCLNAMCATLFEGQGGRSEIAFVSDKNIHATNLFTMRMLADDLNWDQIMTRGSSTAIALVNNPEKEELLFYYKNTDSSQGVEQYKCLHLSYNEKHMRSGGRLKISGPVHLRNKVGSVFSDLYSAWAVRRTNGATDIFLGYGGSSAGATSASAGYVLREQGYSNPAADPTYKIKSRRMYLAGMGNEFRLDKIFTYIASSSGTQDLTITPYYTLTNDASGPTSSSDAQTRTISGEKMFVLDFSQNVEGLDIEYAQSTATPLHLGLQHMLLLYTGQGIEDSGKS